MTLDSKGTSARLYRHFYSTEYLPKSFCSWFWGIFFAYILIVPITIINIPVNIVNRFLSEDNRILNNPILKCLISILFFASVFGIGYVIYNIIQVVQRDGIEVLFVFLGVIGALGLIAWSIARKPNPHRKSNISEGYRAFKNKFCPIIDWE